MKYIQEAYGGNLHLTSIGAKSEAKLLNKDQRESFFQELLDTDRARLVITADADASFSLLVEILKECEAYEIDTLFAQSWD